MKASLAITLLQWAKSKVHIYLLRAAIVIDAIICLVVVEYFLVQCSPISYTWRLIDQSVKGTCLPASQQIVVGFALSGTTVSLDMLFLFVPFFMLHGRGVNSRMKIYIYGIFGLGVGCVPLTASDYHLNKLMKFFRASIANFIRLVTLVKLKASTDPLCKSSSCPFTSITKSRAKSWCSTCFSLVCCGSQHWNQCCRDHWAPPFDAKIQCERLRRFFRPALRRYKADKITKHG